jgi:hypothetical protein
VKVWHQPADPVLGDIDHLERDDLGREGFACLKDATQAVALPPCHDPVVGLGWTRRR